MPNHQFISYSSVDARDFAIQLYDVLKAGTPSLVSTRRVISCPARYHQMAVPSSQAIRSSHRVHFLQHIECAIRMI